MIDVTLNARKPLLSALCVYACDTFQRYLGVLIELATVAVAAVFAAAVAVTGDAAAVAAAALSIRFD